MFLDDMKTGKKLISGFLVIVGIAVIISIVGFVFISAMDDMGDELYNDRLIPLNQIGIIDSSLYLIRGDAYKALLIPEEKDRSLERINIAIATVNEQLTMYGKTKITGDEKKKFDVFSSAWKNYETEIGPVLTAIQANDIDTGLHLIAAGTSLSDARANMDVAISDLRKINIDVASDLKVSQDNDAAMAKTTMVILTIIAALIGIGLGVYLTKSITTPLARTVTMIEAMNKGNLTMRLGLIRKDEIGIMARAMDEFADALQHVVLGKMKDIADGKQTDLIEFRDDTDEIAPAVNATISALQLLLIEINKLTDAASKGILNIRGDPAMFKGGYQDIINGINSTLDAVVIPLNEAMRLAGSYSKGVYTDRFDSGLSVTGEFSVFRDALNQVGIGGSEAIGEVQNQVEALLSGMEESSASVEEVTASSGVLAQSSNKVSELAEHSGEGVKQVLRAMDDLSITVSSVSTKAEQVSSLSMKAVDLSQEGAALAGRAEDGMQGIITSFSHMDSLITDISRQMAEIGHIVKVISDIAEQTNLLALNAAIEAARAGDAGLGFAVVADEVKSLALESQKSAENISGIIGTLQQMSREVNEAMKHSSGEVKAGGDAVALTLKVFGNIVSSVNDISSNMGEVAGATEEQAAAVEQITASVNELGTLVEQTAKEAVGSAAASEESSAALDQISQVIAESAESVNRISREMNKFVVH
jgi:methyl-accepting chemotaxis protein